MPYASPTPYAWTSAGETPDELVQRLEFTTVLCKNTGEPVDILDRLANRQLTQQLNLPSSYTITMRMDDASYPFALLEQAPRLKVYRVSTPAELAIDPLTVNQLVFYGTLPSQGISEDAASGMAQLAFQDPMWMLNDRYVETSVSFAQVDQGSILWQLIALMNAQTNGDTFIRQGSVTTGTLRDRTYDAGKQIASMIQEMTQVDGGCDVSFIPVDYWSLDGSDGMGTFNAYAQRGADLVGTEFVYAAAIEAGIPGGLQGNVGNMVRTRAKTITRATSVGSADTQVYQNTTSPYGLLEDYETFSDVSISQTLLDKSVGKVANGQNAPMILEIQNPTLEAPQPILDYNPGDTVYATCRRGGMEFYDLAVRVHGIDIQINQEGALTTKPTLATLPETIVSPVLPPGGGGGVPGGGGDVPGSERISFPVGSGPLLFNPSTDVTHPPDTIIAVTGTSSLVVVYPGGTMSGLVTGTDYTLSCLARGNDAAPAPGGSTFQIYAGPTSGGVFGTNDAAHIWSATLATRQAWTLQTVTFTATSSGMSCGIRFATQDLGVKAYTCEWSVVPA